MSESLSDSELEWVELRRELDSMAAKELKDRTLYRDNWIIKGGIIFTCFAFAYGFYNMNHPLKSTFGAYCRIFGQGVVGVAFCYGYLKYNSVKTKTKINMEYHD